MFTHSRGLPERFSNLATTWRSTRMRGRAPLLEEDIWYIFPAKRLEGQISVNLSPHRAKSPHGRYKEAWELLDSRKRASIRVKKDAADAIGRKRKRPTDNGAAGNPKC